MATLTLQVIVDDEGKFALFADDGDGDPQNELFDDTGSANAKRTIRLVVNVPEPEPVEIDVNVPAAKDEPATVTVT